MTPNAPPAEPPREAAWKRWEQALFLQRLRVGSFLAAVMVPLGWGLDLVVHPLQARLFLAIRLAFGALFLLIWALSWVPSLAKRPAALSWILCVEIAIGIEVLVLRTGGMRSEYYAGLLVLLIAAGLLFPWGAVGMTSVCAGFLAVHLLPALWLPPPATWKPFLVETYFLVNGALVAVVAAYYGRRARRREFDQRAELEQRTGELKEATGNLRETVEQLREVDRVKNRFFANVSHELRTPLTVILAVLETLPSENLSKDAKDKLGVLGREAWSLLRMINDLLTLVELDSGRAQLQRRPLDLGELVRRQVQEFAPLAERRGLQLTCDAKPRGTIAADPVKLETVIRNLLSNALKFTPEGGKVHVSVRDVEDGLSLSVADTGPGIAKTDQAKIFDRFTRLPGAEGAELPGWGIGLSLVREVVALHDGRIELDSAPGKGTRFRVILPFGEHEVASAHAEVQADSTAAPLPPAPPAGVDFGPLPEDVVWDPVGQAPAAPSSWRILIAEDHAELRGFLVGFLKRYFQVIESSDGQEALAKVRAERPDLVLADVMMPRLSGHDLVTAIRADGTIADTRVVLITAQRGTEAAIRGLTLGADDFVAKPFSPHELVARIDAQLRIRELDRSLAQAQKLATLGTLLAGLAHEIRNPVNVLVNGVPVLRRELPPSGGTAAEIIDVVEESARRVARIVDDLLGAARRDDASLSQWTPADALERTLKLFAHSSQKVAQETDIRFDGVVRGNPDRLDRVVTNLIDNAYRAMEDHGGTLTARCVPDGKGIRIEIQDTGPGIPPDVLPRLFDPFFTTRRVGEGTGLGLHLCREIVLAHRGRMDVRSSAQGATFTVWLPTGEA
jgi:signal transduction histidine kinase